MAYIGKSPSTKFSAAAKVDTFTGDGSTTTFDLANIIPAGGENGLQVFVNNVRQKPGASNAFTVGNDGSGDLKRITFTAAPANSAAIYVITSFSNEAFKVFDTNGVELFLDADGDMQHSANLVYNGTTFTAEDITMAGGTLGTANSNQDLQIDPSGTGTLNLVIASQATVGSAGSASALPGQPEGYLPIKINGTLRVIPFYKQS